MEFEKLSDRKRKAAVWAADNSADQSEWLGHFGLSRRGANGQEQFGREACRERTVSLCRLSGAIPKATNRLIEASVL